MKEKLAKISSARMEIKERDILNFWVHVEYEDGGGQGVGGIALDEWDKIKDRRVGTAYGCEMIRRLLKVLDVDDLSEVKGKYIWVLGEGEYFSFQPLGLRQMSSDGGACLIFKDVYEEFCIKEDRIA